MCAFFFHDSFYFFFFRRSTKWRTEWDRINFNAKSFLNQLKCSKTFWLLRKQCLLSNWNVCVVRRYFMQLVFICDVSFEVTSLRYWCRWKQWHNMLMDFFFIIPIHINFANKRCDFIAMYIDWAISFVAELLWYGILRNSQPLNFLL